MNQNLDPEAELQEIARGLLHTLRASLELYGHNPRVAEVKLRELRLLISELEEAIRKPEPNRIAAISADSTELAAFIHADLGGCSDCAG